MSSLLNLPIFLINSVSEFCYDYLFLFVPPLVIFLITIYYFNPSKKTLDLVGATQILFQFLIHQFIGKPIRFHIKNTTIPHRNPGFTETSSQFLQLLLLIFCLLISFMFLRFLINKTQTITLPTHVQIILILMTYFFMMN